MANNLSVLKIGSTSYTLDPDYLGGIAASNYVTKDLIASALQYKGELTTDYTPAAEVGHVYVVASARTVNGISCEAGDLWMCNTATGAATSSNVSTVNECWDIVQSNIDLTVLDNKYADMTHTHSIAARTSGGTSITPEGTVSKPTFTGTAASHNHTASQEAHSHTFTGTEATLEHSFTGSSTTFSGNYTPAGTISKITHTPAGSVAIGTGEGTANYTPSGSVESAGGHSHSGKVSISYTPAGSVTISKGTGTANYTPAGTNAAASSHTHTFSASVDYTPAGSISEASTHTHSFSGSVSYTPAGSVASHSHTVTVNPTIGSALTGVSVSGGGFSSTYDSTSKTLTLTSVAAAVSSAPKSDFVKSVSATTASVAPKFTGTEATISHSGTTGAGGAHDHDFTGTEASIAHSGTTAGGGSHNHTFTGTGAQLVGTFSGTAATLTDSTLEISTAGGHTHTFTGDGTELTATFTGTEYSVTPTFTGTQKSVSVSGTPKGSVADHTYTPAGTTSSVTPAITVADKSITPAGSVSQPTFTGTAKSHTHSIPAATTGTPTEA